MTIHFGADPELFVEKENGSLLYAFDFLKDRDKDPALTEDGNQVYPDGFQAEFNITPSPYVLDAVRSIGHGLKTVITEARKIDPKAKLSSNPVVHVGLEIMGSVSPRYTEFGCKPSYNAYGVSGMSMPGNLVPDRFAGGHIHIGDPELQDKDSDTYKTYVRNLDAILGIACVSLAENIDSPVRRKYYGLAGEYRKPPHGLEYRVLSNFWIYSPTLATVILQLCKNILLFTKANGTKGWNAEESEITEAIILSDVNLARKILLRNQAVLNTLSTGIDFSIPVEKSIPSIKNIEKNWGI